MRIQFGLRYQHVQKQKDDKYEEKNIDGPINIKLKSHFGKSMLMRSKWNKENKTLLR